MTRNALKLALGVAFLSLVVSAAVSGEKLSGQIALTGASSTCPSGMATSGQVVAVNIVLPDGSAGAGQKAPSISLAGEIRDFTVAGCTVSFEGVSVDRTTYAAMDGVGGIAHQRGCRGYCGL